MRWERIQANWQHFKVSARARWGMITTQELDVIGGRRELLTGHIEEVYGITLAKAQAQVEAWRGEQREPAPGPAA
jgi:uncharacterized protein YjbJ (UPF0337 family)